MEIGDSCVETPSDHRFRDVVPALRHPVRHAGHCQILAGQLEEKQGHLITGFSPLRNHPRIGAPVEGGLDGETFSPPHTFRDHFKHQSGGANRRLLRAEVREPLRDQVCIDEGEATCLVRQKLPRKRRLTRAIRPGDDDDGIFEDHAGWPLVFGIGMAARSRRAIQSGVALRFPPQSIGRSTHTLPGRLHPTRRGSGGGRRRGLGRGWTFPLR